MLPRPKTKKKPARRQRGRKPGPGRAAFAAEKARKIAELESHLRDTVQGLSFFEKRMPEKAETFAFHDNPFLYLPRGNYDAWVSSTKKLAALKERVARHRERARAFEALNKKRVGGKFLRDLSVLREKRALEEELLGLLKGSRNR